MDSAAALTDLISQTAAAVAIDGDIRHNRSDLHSALSSIASLAEQQGEHHAAQTASKICRVLVDNKLDEAELLGRVTEALEQLQAAVTCPTTQSANTFSLSQDPELIADFVHESREHLESIEGHLLAVEEKPAGLEPVHAVFRSFHTIKGLAGFLELPRIQEVAHETETVLDQVRQGLASITPALVDVILESRDYIAKWLVLLENVPGEPAPPAIADNRALLARIRSAATTGKDEQPPETAGIPSAPIMAAEPAGAVDGASRKRLVKVDTGKLDYLVDMVGEVVIAQSLVRHSPELEALRDSPVGRNLAQLARITEEIQRTAMAMRMVPIGPLFQKMARLVRDLSRKSGKQIVFESEGEGVELDRTIVEELADPLMHMIRNSADHGIEDPAARIAAGKAVAGRIGLRAFHRSGQIVIEISDDGAGLRRSRILAKAREKGLIAPNESLTDSECLNLIFRPGFSTAEKVSDISGRGVGMDVVRRQIQRLRGSIDITSTEGRGTTFSLRLPLTLAIIEGLVVSVGTERYIIPLASVKELLRPVHGMVSTVENRAELVRIRDRMLPLVRLHRRFGIEPKATDPCAAVLVVAEIDGQCFCMMVDELVGKQEVVIKSLGPVFQHVSGITGGAILGDGRIGLILDLKGIFGGRHAA